MRKLLITIFVLTLLTSFFHAPTPARAATLSRPPNNLSLAGYWNFDEGVGLAAGDKSGNGYTGTISGLTWTDGKHGKALNFSSSGSTNNVLASSFASITSTLTASAWIYPTSYPSERYTIVQGQTPNGFYMSLNSDGSLQTYWYGKSSEGYHSSGASTVPLNTWSHVSVVWNTDGPYLYVNGVLKNNVASTGSGAAQTVINIGAETTSRQFIGKIDDVRVYSRALSAADVLKLYQSGQVTRKTVSNQGLVGYWPLNEGVGLQAGDSSGNGYTGTVAGNPTWTDGRRGKALNFDGTGDVITATGVLSGNSAFTASAWINPADITTSWKSIFGTTCAGFDVAVNAATITFGRNCGGPNGVFYTGPTVSANEWAHVVAVFDGTNIDVYKNGVKTTGGAVTYSHGATTFIGGSYSSSAELFLGKIDDVRIWNRALSATEVLNLYKQTETKVNSSQNSRLTDGLVGLWSFNGPDYNSASTTAEVLEKSGRSFNGDASNTPVTTIGKVGQGLLFDGTDDHVLIPADDTNFVTGATGTLSFSFWMKPTALGGTILSRRHPCNNDGHFRIYINGSTMNLSFYSDLDTGTYTYGSGNILSTGLWQHITITKQWGTASATKLYLNGVAQTFTPSGSDTARGTTYTTLEEIIGAEAGGGCNGNNGPKANFFNGSIDEVRIYNRVLSATDVLQLYNMGK